MLTVEKWITNVSSENGLDPEQIKRKIQETRTEEKNKRKARNQDDGKRKREN